MKYLPHVITNDGIIVTPIGKAPVTVPKTASNFRALMNAVCNEDWDSAVSCLNLSNAIKVAFDGRAEVCDGQVLLDGEVVRSAVSTKILSIMEEGREPTALFRFVDRVRKNPSSIAVDELYDFLEYRELPLLEDGRFLAYKGVNLDGWSQAGNTKTVVLQGKVDKYGHIHNAVGNTIEVERRSVDDRRENECSHGLHVGSYDYATGWGRLVFAVAVDPADAVSVPKDCQFQKCRVTKYEILYDTSDRSEVTDSVVGAKGRGGRSDLIECALGMFQATSFIEVQNALKCSASAGELYETIVADMVADEEGEESVIRDVVSEVLYEHGINVEVAEDSGDETPDLSGLIDAIEKYVDRKGEATLRQIQSALHGRANLSCEQIEQIVNDNTWLDVALASPYSHSVVSV